MSKAKRAMSLSNDYRAPNPVPTFRKLAQDPDLGADKAFMVGTIAVIDGGGRNADEKIADMRDLIDAYLAETGQESLGWLRATSPSDKS